MTCRSCAAHSRSAPRKPCCMNLSAAPKRATMGSSSKVCLSLCDPFSATPSAATCCCPCLVMKLAPSWKTIFVIRHEPMTDELKARKFLLHWTTLVIWLQITLKSRVDLLIQVHLEYPSLKQDVERFPGCLDGRDLYLYGLQQKVCEVVQWSLQWGLCPCFLVDWISWSCP